ncbi:YceI family protein [Micrococcales bacterium 31B]|nr:YceI family protein [Micrococcales bacterium 31B]
MTRKRLILILVAAAIVAAGLVFAGTRIYASTLTADEQFAAQGAAGASIAAADATGTWSVATDSNAGYRVGEVLAGQQVTVTGRTTEVTGTVSIADSKIESGTITVNLTNVATDDEGRDEQFRSLVIDTAANPEATFVLTSPVDLGDLTGTATDIAATGDLTIKGVTQSVDVTLKAAALSATSVSVSVDIPLTWTDFGVTPPDLGFVKVENTGSIEALLTLNKQ